MPDWMSIRELSRQSILFIRVHSSDLEGRNEKTELASGFIVSTAGFLVTAAHVWPEQTQGRRIEVTAYFSPQYTSGFKLTYIKLDRDLDLAIFRLPTAPPGGQWQPLTLTSSANVPDEAPLCVLGFPLAQELSFAEGRLSNRFGFGGKFQTTLPLTHGYSGGPVFDISGRVIGVAAGGFDQAQGVTHVIPSDYLRGVLLSAGLEVEKPSSTPPYAPVYPVFKPLQTALPDLGEPIAAAELSDDTYQAAYDNAHVIWVKQLLRIFVLPTDHKRTAMLQGESHWTTDKELFDDDKLRIIFGEPPPGKYPPHGGVAYFWKNDPNSWKWIGWRQWFCRFFNEVYYQEFENGIILGTFHVHPDTDHAEIFVILKDGRWVSRLAPGAKAPKCRVIAEPFPVYVRP